MITRGEVNTRDEGIQLGRQFIEAGVFRHGKRERERGGDLMYKNSYMSLYTIQKIESQGHTLQRK